MDEGGRETLIRQHQDASSGICRNMPCTNLNIDILKSHVISPIRGKHQISF